MNEIIPRCAVSIRAAEPTDLKFIDDLQRISTKMVGWMPTKQLEGKIAAGHVIVAESGGLPVGYCIGHDRYFKRDDVGIIYQVNIAPSHRRSLVGAMLIKAMFDRAAYGCRLFCCWCAQDIEANSFWESLGFVPLAFRAGSATKDRLHIFWQRRIREGDVTTPYWFPAQTSAGSLREDRLVLPIPPGKSWRDVMPRVLPTTGAPIAGATNDVRALPSPSTSAPKPNIALKRRSMRFGPPPATIAAPPATIATPVEAIAAPKPVKAKKAKTKNDPTLVAAARELRDRWLEQVNAGAAMIESQGKYAMARQIEAKPVALLPAA